MMLLMLRTMVRNLRLCVQISGVNVHLSFVIPQLCVVLLPSYIANMPILWACADPDLPRLEIPAVPHPPILTIAASFRPTWSNQ